MVAQHDRLDLGASNAPAPRRSTNSTRAAALVPVAAAVYFAVRKIVEGTPGEHARWLEQILADPDLEHVATEPHIHRHRHGHGHDDNCRHLDHGVDSTWVDVQAAVDVEELEDQLAELPANYVRIKGIVRGAADTWYAIHRVGLRASSEPLGDLHDKLGPFGRLVALGTDLDSEKLADCLRAARVKS